MIKTANKSHLALCGNYGASNLGDEAILSGIITLVRSASPDTEVTVLSANPAETTAIHGIAAMAQFPAGIRSFLQALFTGELMMTIKKAKRMTGLLLGGGGLFTDEKIKAVIIWAIQASWFRWLKKPLFCLGQSVGPLRTWIGRRLTANVYHHATAATVRDTASAETLSTIGVGRPLVMADPAFAIHLEQPARLDQRGSSGQEDYLVLSVRPWIRGNPFKLYPQLAKLMDYVVEKYGFRIVMVPFQVRQDDDSKELRKIRELMRHKDRGELRTFTADFRQVIQLIAGAKLTVGMRLHSLIFSAIAGTPFLAMSYSAKVRNFCHEMGTGNYILDFEEFNLTAAKKTLDTLMKNHDAVRGEIVDSTLRMRNLVHQHEELIRNFIAVSR